MTTTCRSVARTLALLGLLTLTVACPNKKGDEEEHDTEDIVEVPLTFSVSDAGERIGGAATTDCRFAFKFDSLDEDAVTTIEACTLTFELEDEIGGPTAVMTLIAPDATEEILPRPTLEAPTVEAGELLGERGVLGSWTLEFGGLGPCSSITSVRLAISGTIAED